ncbi:TPR end-of-group domain-containing protein [Winogradskyella haliclonae]|uniref:Tetratricopeptide repeat protein n=1 Tax=Winogradskyella haliclonae TaxID=2048558 RepID=A0ABQ2C0J7_9FLAO|nr:hypothetical protein [Winogradskyella haliclonae]GGI57592.1 hypothetical protein GCM10011444_19010 [Winogradskyella haliclonae]
MKIIMVMAIMCLYNNNIYSQHTVTIKKGSGQNFTMFQISGDTTKYRFKSKIAKYKEQYKEAANLLIKAIDKGEFEDKEISLAYYEIACYFSMFKIKDKAVKYLKESINNGWSDMSKLEFDEKLSFIKDSDEWTKLISPLLVLYYKEHNKELAKLYSEDQQVRLNGQYNNLKVIVQDSIRRFKVMKFIENDKLKSGYDYYKAAMIMHHGSKTEDYKIAHKLAQKSLKFDSTHEMAPWLCAATKDRLLLSQDKPQWYGTQGISVTMNHKIMLDPKLIDTTAVSTLERRRLNAPTIEKLREYINNFKSE